MTTAFWFWVIYVISLVFSGVSYWRNENSIFVPLHGLVWYILVGLLGYQVFGSPWK